MSFELQAGRKYLITCDNSFVGADGQYYNAVYGTIKGIHKDEDLLGTYNRKGTNWFIEIGDMMIAGCQVHYALQTDSFEFKPYEVENVHEGRSISSVTNRCWVYVTT